VRSWLRFPQWLQIPIAILCLCALAAAIAQTRITGTVHDASGAAIPNAIVELRSGAWRTSVTTDITGHFAVDRAPSTGTATIRADGFAEQSRSWAVPEGNSAELDIALSPGTVAEHITVSATRTELPVAQAPASVQVLSTEQLSSSGAVMLDDALRQVAGFGTFRRNSSRVANPTTQGVSLRGVGSSGASRAEVLLDGVPLNDPFGGWVYWDRVPRESLASVEVLEGGASALYGSNALGGVIDLRSLPVSRGYVSAEGDYGSVVSPNGSIFATGERGGWGGSVAAQAFSTNGYILVDPAQRGRVDVPADSAQRVGGLTLQRIVGKSGVLFARGSWFREQRGNGTPITFNDTELQQGIFGGDFSSANAGTFGFRVYGDSEYFHQSFSSVALDRNSEKLSRLQRVPVDERGASGQWSRAFGTSQLIVVGGELHDVRGHSFETVFGPAGAATSIVDAGGRQRTAGFYAEDVIHATSRLLFTAAARVDRWRNFDAFSNTTPLPSAKTTLNALPERSELAFSPRLGANFRVNRWFAFTASGYRAFRAPSLNELYRTFRVGNALTLANSNLAAEWLTGAEGGGMFSFGRVTARATYFWNNVSDPIANVTLTSTPALITRQRQNLGNTRSAGVEAQVEARVRRDWFVSAGYQFADATVTSFPADPTLVGLWVPQVPHHQFTVNTTYSNPRIMTLGIQGRAIGQQFDDDRNQFPLESFFNLDAFISRSLGHGVEVLAAVENALNQRYSTARTPTRTISGPLSARVGLRIRLGSER
jgi:outer membrane receptor protein involved in Fe transport